MKTLKLFGTQGCQIFDVLKRYASRTQFLGAIKNMASLGTFAQNAKWRKPPTNSAVTEPK